MLTRLLDRYVKRVFYVRLSEQRVSVLDAQSGEQIIEAPPLLALDAAGAIIAVGQRAQEVACERRVNPFDHPRTILANFSLAEALLKHMFKRIPSGAFSASPYVVMHPLSKLEGGITQIEARALRELAMGVGARSAHVWVGRELAVQELLALDYSQQNSDELQL